MITIIIGQRGQITLPSEIRRKYGMQEGDRIALVQLDDQLILRPITQTLFDLRGSVPVPTVQDFAAIRQRVIGDRAMKAARNEE